MATPTTVSARKHHNKTTDDNSSPTSTPIINSLLKTNWKRRFHTTRTPYRFASNNSTPSSSAASDEKLPFVSTTKNVMLLDWWLIKLKIEGSNNSPSDFKFGVGGSAFDGRASTYFCSGEIVKRHDEMTLETVDGVTITLASLLNRIRTLENGFPSQVCDHFFLGFPFDWEEFGTQYFGGQSIHGARLSKVTHTSPDDIDDPRCLLSSFDDIPVTRLFDHMMVSSGDYNDCSLTRSVFDHILSEYGSSSAKINEEDPDQIIAEDSLPNETRTPLNASEENNKPFVARRCSLDKAFKDQPEDKNDNVILDDMPMGTTHNFLTIHSQSKMDEDVRELSRELSKFVLTSSRTRLETLTNYQPEGLPLNTTTCPDTTPRTSAGQYRTTVTNVASVSQSAIPNVENIKVDTVLDSSHLGNDVATRRGTISEMSTSSQELNFSSATLDPEVTAPIFAPEVSGNHSRVPQIDMESRTLHKSRSKRLRRNLNTSSGLLTRSQASGVLTRSRAKSKEAENPDVTAEEYAVHLAQTTKISDSCPTSEAEKSEKEESSSHVPNKFSKVNPEVRRSGRTRNVVQYREP